MDSIWRDIVIKKGAGGAGRITEEEKDAVITMAVSTWKRMGFTQEQIAFGIATMNVESGFNSAAKYPGPESTAYGLWHQGVYADVDGDEKSLKHYLDNYFSNSGTDRFLNNTYLKADDALDVADILHEGGIRAPSREIIWRFTQSHGGLPSGESLMRDKVDYTIVHRIEPNGSTRGYFIIG